MSKGNPIFEVELTGELVNLFMKAIETTDREGPYFQQMLAGIVNEDKVFVDTSLPPDDGPATVLKIKLKSDLTALFIGDSITDGGWGEKRR